MEIVDRSKGYPRWSEARLIRYGVTFAAVVCAVGLMLTMGGTFAPWVGWAAGLLAFGVPAFYMTARYMDARADARDRQDPEPANYGDDVPEM
jgi:hypothetical protein